MTIQHLSGLQVSGGLSSDNPRFLVTRLTDLTVVENSNFGPTFPTVIYDTALRYEASTGIFTAPSSGFYHFEFAWVWGAAGDSVPDYISSYLELVTDGGPIPLLYTNQRACEFVDRGLSLLVSGDIFMESSAKIRPVVESINGPSLMLGGSNRFSGTLLP